MGQCITIEVNGQNGKRDQTKGQISNHQRKSKNNAPGQRVRSSSKPRKMKKAQREESSDEETSDEEMLNANAEFNPNNDPNFGKQQSPINIVTCGHGPLVCKPMAEEDFKNNPLRFNYPDEIRGCTIINTGHTVQVNIPDHAKCTMYINSKTYTLKQFHFHTPSEHTIDDKQYEMEMHLVHINDDGEIAVLGFIFTTKQMYFQPTLALSKSRRFLIKKTQSIIMQSGGKGKEEHPVHQDADNDSDLNTDDEFEEEENGQKGGAAANGAVSPGGGDEIDRRRSSVKQLQANDFLDQFWEDLPLKKTTEEVRLDKPISFDYLFETASKTFKKNVESNMIHIDMEIFEYAGSLTTPPYTEGVHWLLSKQTHFINVKQLNKLSSCWGHHNNAREVQEYHGRKVQMRNQSSLRGYFFN